MKISTIFFTTLFSFTFGAKPCHKAGLFCENCTSLIACIEEDDTWIREPVGTCESPYSCYRDICILNTTDPICTGLADLKFVCRKTGIFPDPFYCNKFVMCIYDSDYGTFRPYVETCEDGFRYNVESSLCDIPLPQEFCEDGEYPLPLCTTLGQTGAVLEKPEMYYVCEEHPSDDSMLYPVLDVCPPGHIYDNFQCKTKDS